MIQLFDSWVGALSAADYAEYVEPYSARILAAVDAPTIHFGTGATEPLLEALVRAAATSSASTGACPQASSDDRGVQGNLDPAVLLGPWDIVERERSKCSRRARPLARLQPRSRRAAADGSGGARRA